MIYSRHLKNPKPGIKLFLAADFPDIENKFMLFMDLTSKRVILETIDKKDAHQEHIVADSLDIGPSNHFKNVMLLLDQKEQPAKLQVYVDCVLQGEIPVKKSLREMALEAAGWPVQVQRAHWWRTKVYGDSEIQGILNRCPLTTLYNVDEWYTMPTNTSLARKPRRGDIPGEFPDLVDPNGCHTDEMMAKTLNMLIDAIKKMWTKLDLNLVETKRIKELIENCAACREAPPGPRRSCRQNSPCFPGAECRDTPNGPQCLSCPPGYRGNGIQCRRPVRCRDNPCFAGVDCQDGPDGYMCGPCPHGFLGDGQHCEPPNGCNANPCYPNVSCTPSIESPYYRCGRCPSGYIGNGQRCEQINGCQRNPCFPKVPCSPLTVPPYFRCGRCPDGYTGNGSHCLIEDECDLAKPCWHGVGCHKFDTGYRCDPCPVGMTGNSSEGRGIAYAMTHRQVCYLLDPCNDGNNGGCVENSECFNSEGTAICGPCLPDYDGNQTVGCRFDNRVCRDGMTRCDYNAHCVNIAGSRYICRVNISRCEQ